MTIRCFLLALVVALYLEVAPFYSQITTPCLNFLTNSTTNGSTTPAFDCCNSLKTLTSRGIDCLCLIVTGSVPYQIPINRTLAISLPRACRMPGVSLQCKAPAGAPIPAPGPAALGPALSPRSSSTVPEASSPNTTPESNITPALSPPAPESDTTSTLTPPSTDGGSGVLTPPSTGGASGVPTTDAGSRPSLTPSSVASSYANSAFVLVASEVTFILYFLF